MEAQENVALIAAAGAAGAEPSASASQPTVHAMLWERVERWAGATAFREKTLGYWRSVTWREFGDSAAAVGAALLREGLAPGESVCVLAQNRLEWAYADLAILGAGGVSVGIYPTTSAVQLEYLLIDCGCRFIFVEDEEQLDKVLAVRAKLSALARVYVFDMEGLDRYRDPMVRSFAELLAADGKGTMREAWLARMGAATPESTALIIYTSGTTGPPKGALIRHRNVTAQLTATADALDLRRGDERLSFLPLCHGAERLIGYYACLFRGAILNFAESLDAVTENACELAPTLYLSVPRGWEKLHSFVTLRAAEAPRLQRLAYRIALAIGLRAADRILAEKPVPLPLRIARWLAYGLVFRNLRQMMGVDRCRYLLTGGAPIAPELVRWYLALGLPLLDAYGQTEAAGIICFVRPGRMRLGTVGQAMPGIELRIAPNGEVLVRGSSVFAGYLNQPELTRATLADGWLHTGDVGAIDADGFLRITDRLKDIIVTAGGKNIAPSEIENSLKCSPYIADAIVLGDRRKYLTALVLIDQENVAQYAQTQRIPYTDFASLCRAREVVSLIAQEIEGVNRVLARVETLKKFRILDQLLTPEDDEMTPTMKMKRKLVGARYADLIESMYAED